jgi:hypothetical protein
MERTDPPAGAAGAPATTDEKTIEAVSGTERAAGPLTRR